MKVLVSWSGGKDACVALHRLRSDRTVVVQGLLTTLVPDPARVNMHEVGAELVSRQAAALGLPLVAVPIPEQATNAQYEAALATAVQAERAGGVEAIAYGDLHLADIRAYRDALAERMGVRAVYPVWGRDTGAFARAAIGMGVKAVICSVDTTSLPLSFVGRAYDDALLADLPSQVDPCGEDGEFHTFVHDGPGFTQAVKFRMSTPEMRGSMGVLPLTIA